MRYFWKGSLIRHTSLRLYLGVKKNKLCRGFYERYIIEGEAVGIGIILL